MLSLNHPCLSLVEWFSFWSSSRCARFEKSVGLFEGDSVSRGAPTWRRSALHSFTSRTNRSAIGSFRTSDQALVHGARFSWGNTRPRKSKHRRRYAPSGSF